ncbi:MAG: TerC family protein [Bacteroidia bacterium]|nr:TerC family protein [Bacteroidia bacterium]
MLANIDFSFAPLLTSAGLVSLFTLVMLEIVLGIDNIIFIAIICGRLPIENQKRARTIGLMLALIMRVLLLMLITEIASMTNPLFYIKEFGVSGRDLILFAGGWFLIIKTIIEINHKFKIADDKTYHEKKITMMAAIIQIIIIDLVFSFDSILTAVGLSSQIIIMILAVVVSMFVMLFFAKYVSDFVNKYPTVKMLALCFLVVIGALLVIESLHIHIEGIDFKSYAYVAMAFSLIVELLNIRLRNVLDKKANDD